ncbi:YpiB family protein [Jeotgalibaca caeni]|uniref:YpiB family protein n=1 Tax=Jeotgalibaca caeni TaxID=3028623 RepID=UPI00237ECB41|nr:YpiB family protein [Jeotgalibaca caeni]MDE1549361.1 YpiB family protein [Jeotgalibaca caeni]
MNQPSLEEKKSFLTWFIQNHQLKRRESLWILNYLLNHELLLKNIHFVENIAITNRGMGLASIESSNEPFVYYKEGKKFDDPEQAFHDLRLNWKEEFYLELYFHDSYLSQSAFGILENNPFEKDEDRFDPSLERIVDSSLERLAWQERKRDLMKLIDAALVDKDEEKFKQYTEELRSLDEKNMI